MSPFDWLLWKSFITNGLDTGDNSEDHEIVFRYAVMTLARTVLITAVIAYLTLWYRNARCGDVKLENATLSSPLWHKLLDVFVRCQPFNVAWCWNEVLTFSFFRVCFGCHGGSSFLYSNCGGFSLWLQIAFSAGITLALVLMVPVLKRRESALKQLDGVYISTILTSDKWFIRNSVVYDGLYHDCLGISELHCLHVLLLRKS